MFKLTNVSFHHHDLNLNYGYVIIFCKNLFYKLSFKTIILPIIRLGSRIIKSKQYWVAILLELLQSMVQTQVRIFNRIFSKCIQKIREMEIFKLYYVLDSDELLYTSIYLLSFQLSACSKPFNLMNKCFGTE